MPLSCQLAFHAAKAHFPGLLLPADVLGFMEAYEALEGNFILALIACLIKEPAATQHLANVARTTGVARLLDAEFLGPTLVNAARISGQLCC